MKLNKDIIQGFIAAALMSLFSLLVVINSKKNSEKEISEINKILANQEAERHQAELREHLANVKRDSALSALNTQNNEMNLMNKNFTSLNAGIFNMQSLFNQKLTELKNFQNEKDHVIDAPVSEQFDFLSKYRYKEYSGGTNP